MSLCLFNSQINPADGDQLFFFGKVSSIQDSGR
jgi:hypothetical protein